VGADTWGDCSKETLKTEEDKFDPPQTHSQSMGLEETLKFVKDKNMDYSLTEVEEKNKKIIDSFRPMHLLTIVNKEKEHQLMVDVKRLLKLGLLDIDSTL